MIDDIDALIHEQLAVKEPLMDSQTIYRIDEVGSHDNLRRIGYARGNPVDIEEFYNATYGHVCVTPIEAPRITRSDAQERVRLENIVRSSAGLPSIQQEAYYRGLRLDDNSASTADNKEVKR
ncbi:TPA: hypothetical protein HA251_06815 [Candidatus Woesearchaeota archaeon]|nr:hypothetical protein [Candidatus Woesearchaeota archaeon]